MRLMLAHHPLIAFAANFEFLVDAISPDGRLMKRANLRKMRELNREFTSGRLKLPPAGNVHAIATDFLEQIHAAKPAAQVIGIELHRDFDRLLWLWPEAKFIHLVRDGRDVAMSIVPTGWAGNMWHAIRAWVDAEALWERMSHKLPRERQLNVKYEMLARDPEYELRRITDFLGVPFDQAMLRFNQDGTYSTPKGDSMGKWRTKADPADLSAAEHRAARWLLQNGYFLSGTVRPPSIVRRAALNIQNRMKTSQHKRGLVGTGLWLGDMFTNRLGGKKAKAKLTRQKNEILDREK